MPLLPSAASTPLQLPEAHRPLAHAYCTTEHVWRKQFLSPCPAVAFGSPAAALVKAAVHACSTERVGLGTARLLTVRRQEPRPNDQG